LSERSHPIIWNRLRQPRLATFIATILAAPLLAGGSYAAGDPKTEYTTCSTKGGILFGWVEYNRASQSTVYVSRTGFNIERNGGKHNNVSIRLCGEDGKTKRTYWSWTSKDDVVGGRNYSHDVKMRVPLGTKPYMEFHATFDITLFPIRSAQPASASSRERRRDDLYS
jgi:hypothetical protein